MVVTEVPFLDETGVQRGFTSDYDLTEFTDHYTTAHPDDPGASGQVHRYSAHGRGCGR